MPCLFFLKHPNDILRCREIEVINRLGMPKHSMTSDPGGKKTSINKGGGELPHTAMKAEIHINASFDVIATCGKCEIKPLRAEPFSQKHPRTKSILQEKRFLRGQCVRRMSMHLFRNN